MTVKPAKVLPIELTQIDWYDPTFNPPDVEDWPNNTDRWQVTFSVTAIPHSWISHNSGFYNGLDVIAGDWFTTTGSGLALQIEQVLTATSSSVTAIAKDVRRYNTFMDPNQGGMGELPRGKGFLFEVKNGSPILHPLPDAMPANVPTNVGAQLMARAFLVGGEQGTNSLGEVIPIPDIRLGTGGSNGGGSDYLTTPTNGNYTQGLYSHWQANVTKLADAILEISKAFKDINPQYPEKIENCPVISDGGSYGGVDYEYWMSTSIVNRTQNPALPSPGPVFRIFDTTKPIVIPGVFYEKGYNISLVINGIIRGEINDLGWGGNGGRSDGSLLIADDYYYPRGQTSLRYAIDIHITEVFQEGYNVVELNITGSTTKVVKIVYDNVVSQGTITQPDVSEQSVTYQYSSGVPHYTGPCTFTMSSTVQNWCGMTFVHPGVVQFRDTFTNNSANISVGTHNLPPSGILNWGPVNVDNVTLAVDFTNTTFVGNFQFDGRLRKANQWTDWVPSFQQLHVISGRPNNAIVEPDFERNSVVIRRVGGLSDGVAPDVSTFSGVDSVTWSSGSSSSLGDISAIHEAVIRDGKIFAEQTDLSVNRLPAGPNFSSKNSVQFVTFAIQGIATGFRMKLIGDTPKTIGICLPGIDVYYPIPQTSNKWFNGLKYANFAKTLWPGHSSADDGCCLRKVDNDYEFTFGSISSKYSKDNIILIRLGFDVPSQVDDMIIWLGQNTRRIVNIFGPSAGVYNPGDTIEFTVEFDDNVTVIGDVGLDIVVE